MKYLIVGLGNIGKEYEHTRHNIGFEVVDYIANKFDKQFELSRLAYTTNVRYAGKSILLIKPTTYVNLSGKAVKYWLSVEKIPLSNLLIIVDDIAFPFGTIRLKPKGSNGGHNGLADIEKSLGTSQYARIRFGIGNNFPFGKQVEYVLGKWTNEEEMELPTLIEYAGNMALDFVKIGLQNTMNKYNKKIKNEKE